MTAYISIPRLEEMQHYKNRTPPWIKLHAAFTLDSYEFSQLADAAKAHLLLIYVLASRMDNKMPYNAQWVAQKIGAREKVDLDGLVGSGFLMLHREQAASEALASGGQNAGASREEQRQNRDREDSKPGPPLREIIGLYHQQLPSLPASRGGESVLRQIKERWKQDKARQNLGWWLDYFARVGASPFLAGNNNRHWKADLLWLTAKGNMDKVLENRYQHASPRFDDSSLKSYPEGVQPL